MIIDFSFTEEDEVFDMEPLDERTDLFPVRSVDGVFADPAGNIDLSEARDRLISEKVTQTFEERKDELIGPAGPPGEPGIQGLRGEQGLPGKDGYTPEKGKDYFDGVDGISPTVGVSPIDGGYRITITDKDGSRTIDLMNGSKGDDGFSPDVNVTDIANGKKITITYAAGANTFYLYDGEDGKTPEKGKDYTDGKDGFSPAVDITDIAGGHRITITDKDGEKSFDVMNGEGAGDVTSAMLSTAIENHNTAADAHDDIRNSIPKNPSDIGAQPVGDYLTAKDIGDVAIAQIKEEFAVGATEEEISNVYEWVQANKPSAFNARQRGCCYGNGYYVVAGTAGQMVYSRDCVIWTMASAFTSDVITGLTYGNGLFCAVDSGGNIFTAATPDGVWTPGLDAGGVINAVRYINNRFVAVGEEGFVATSKNGSEWIVIKAFDDPELYFTDCTWGNGFYIAVGKAGAVYRSVTLETWEDYTIEGFGDIRTARFVAGGFVVGGASGNIAYSSDGANWAMATNNSSLTISYIRDFAYSEKRIYAFSYASNGKGEIWISTDNGATWQVVLTTAGRLWCAAYGDGRFVTSGDSGAIYTLDLGIEWTDEEPAEGASIWHRYIGTLSSGDKIISESYKANKPTPSDFGLTTEKWIFTLEDGSTVTKAVYVK